MARNNWTTGDATTVEAQITKVRLAAEAPTARSAVAAAVTRSAVRRLAPLLRASPFSLDRLRERRC